MTDVTGVVFERDKLYGGFENVSAVSQGMKDAARLTDNFNKLSPNKREAIDMILHKIGRAISGPKDCKDNWTDIQGYAKLIEDTFDELKFEPSFEKGVNYYDPTDFTTLIWDGECFIRPEEYYKACPT